MKKLIIDYFYYVDVDNNILIVWNDNKTIAEKPISKNMTKDEIAKLASKIYNESEA